MMFEKTAQGLRLITKDYNWCGKKAVKVNQIPTISGQSYMNLMKRMDVPKQLRAQHVLDSVRVDERQSFNNNNNRQPGEQFRQKN